MTEADARIFAMDGKKILLKKPLKEHHARTKRGMFAFCELCKKWIEVKITKRDREEGSVILPVTSALDDSNRWVCSECWNIIDVAKYGPYKRWIKIKK